MLLDLAPLEAAGQQWRRVGEEGVRHSDSRWPPDRIGDQVDPLLPSCSRRLWTGVGQQLAGQGVCGELGPRVSDRQTAREMPRSTLLSGRVPLK